MKACLSSFEMTITPTKTKGSLERLSRSENRETALAIRLASARRSGRPHVGRCGHEVFPVHEEAGEEPTRRIVHGAGDRARKNTWSYHEITH
jgi:hypothetical protein